jgi:hypothetical protein
VNLLTAATPHLEGGGTDPAGTGHHPEGVTGCFGVYPGTAGDGAGSYRQARTGGTGHAAAESALRLAAGRGHPPGPRT